MAESIGSGGRVKSTDLPEKTVPLATVPSEPRAFAPVQTLGVSPEAPTIAVGADGSSSENESLETLPTGAVLGRYVILARLGEGGMGVVYAAYDPELDRKIALKLLRAIGDAAGLERAGGAGPGCGGVGTGAGAGGS